jgi:hypothetical protein
LVLPALNALLLLPGLLAALLLAALVTLVALLVLLATLIRLPALVRVVHGNILISGWKLNTNGANALQFQDAAFVLRCGMSCRLTQ